MSHDIDIYLLLALPPLELLESSKAALFGERTRAASFQEMWQARWITSADAIRASTASFVASSPVRGVACNLVNDVEGDTSGRTKPIVDMKTKVAFQLFLSTWVSV